MAAIGADFADGRRGGKSGFLPELLRGFAVDRFQRLDGTQNRGVALILEFSQVAEPVRAAYDWYSFNVLPRLGKLVANDDASYRYLAESIRMHPDQAALKRMMEDAGLKNVRLQWVNEISWAAIGTKQGSSGPKPESRPE